MKFTFEYLKALAHNGQPLDLRTEQLGRTSYMVRAKDLGEFTFDHHTHPATDPFREELRYAFRHYPSPVTLDGEDIQRTPFPDLSRVNTVKATDNVTAFHRVEQHNHTEDEPETMETWNLFAGGILSRNPGSRAVSRNHMAPEPGEHKHWQPAMMVIVHPIQVIRDEEFKNMTQEEFQDLREEKPATTLGKAMAERDIEQIRRTLTHPDMPTWHDGPVYAYLITRPGYANKGLGNGGPIIVNQGEPAVFDEALEWQPETIAAAQALYRTNTGFIPVTPNFGRNTGEPRTIRTLEFQTVPPDPNQKPGTIRPVGEINLSFQVQGDAKIHRAPAPLYFTGEKLDRMIVSYVPSMVTPQDLTTQIVRAYGEYNEYGPADLCMDELENTTRNVKRMVQKAIQANSPGEGQP